MAVQLTVKSWKNMMYIWMFQRYSDEMPHFAARVLLILIFLSCIPIDESQASVADIHNCWECGSPAVPSKYFDADKYKYLRRWHSALANMYLWWYYLLIGKFSTDNIHESKLLEVSPLPVWSSLGYLSVEHCFWTQYSMLVILEEAGVMSAVCDICFAMVFCGVMCTVIKWVRQYLCLFVVLPWECGFLISRKSGAMS